MEQELNSNGDTLTTYIKRKINTVPYIEDNFEEITIMTEQRF